MCGNRAIEQQKNKMQRDCVDSIKECNKYWKRNGKSANVKKKECIHRKRSNAKKANKYDKCYYRTMNKKDIEKKLKINPS